MSTMCVSLKIISKLKKNYWDYQINTNNSFLSKIFNFFVFNFFLPIMNIEFTKNILSTLEEKKSGNNLKSNILVQEKKIFNHCLNIKFVNLVVVEQMFLDYFTSKR